MTAAPNPARPAVPALVPGICSVTFRALDVPDVVGLVADAGLAAIEWGGDVHVPVGDLAAAERARTLCADRGVAVASYGSYWRAEGPDDGSGDGAGDGPAFGEIVRTAVALGAPGIRVWAGRQGSDEASPEDRAAVVRRLAAAADLAAAQGLAVSLEFHRNTLTDTPRSAATLLREVAALRPGAEPPLSTYWQPQWWEEPAGIDLDDAGGELALLDRFLTTVHVFSWAPDGTRLPLAAKEALWAGVFDALVRRARVRGQGHYALLEFVANDEVVAFREDAATFLSLLEKAHAAV